MNIAANEIYSRYLPRTVIGKIIQFPLVRTIIACLFVIVPLIVLKKIIGPLIDQTSEPLASYLRDAFGVVRIAVVILMYRLFTRAIEKRTAVELSAAGSLRETGWGLVLGGAIMTFMVALLWVLSYYSVESVGPPAVILHAFIFFGYAALMEEIVFRVILFRHVEELSGTWGAIILTGLLFGYLHIVNPNATVGTSVFIALQSLVVSACWVLTRRLWLVWGLHAGWNYFQGTIFGVSVSGVDDFTPLLVSTRSGPEWLSGGDFGLEASYVSVVICVVIAVVVIKRAANAGQLLGPLWVRKMRKAEKTAEASQGPAI